MVEVVAEAAHPDTMIGRSARCRALAAMEDIAAHSAMVTAIGGAERFLAVAALRHLFIGHPELFRTVIVRERRY